jgi:hypothetical protein
MKWIDLEVKFRKSRKEKTNTWAVNRAISYHAYQPGMGFHLSENIKSKRKINGYNKR